MNADASFFTKVSIETAWWKQFRDPLLTELIEEAVRHNRGMKVAEAHIREAQALLLGADLELTPHITTHAYHTSQKRSLDALNRRNFVPRDLALYRFGVDTVWEADLWGRLRRSVEARDAELATAEADKRGLLISVVSEVAQSYFELRGYQHQLAVAHKNAENQQSTLNLTEIRHLAGVGTEFDTARAKAQLDTTLATIPPLESFIRHTIHRLSVLLGKLPTALYEKLSDTRPLPVLPDSIHIGQPAELLKRRPDICAAEHQLAVATAHIGMVTADLFPKVTFIGSFSLESSSLTGLAAPGSQAYNFGPRITWAAFDLGHVYAQIKAADARGEAYLAEYEQSVLNALEETEDALVTYVQTQKQEKQLASAADESLKAYQLAHLRFKDGTENFMNVLDTERRLLEDQRQHVQSQTTTAVALVKLYKALGGGWEVFAQ